VLFAIRVHEVFFEGCWCENNVLLSTDTGRFDEEKLFVERNLLKDGKGTDVTHTLAGSLQLCC